MSNTRRKPKRLVLKITSFDKKICHCFLKQLKHVVTLVKYDKIRQRKINIFSLKKNYYWYLESFKVFPIFEIKIQRSKLLLILLSTIQVYSAFNKIDGQIMKRFLIFKFWWDVEERKKKVCKCFFFLHQQLKLKIYACKNRYSWEKNKFRQL